MRAIEATNRGAAAGKRGDERVEITASLGVQPTTLKESERQYFSELGIGLREFVTFDRISRRMVDTDEKGVITNFVKPNSPANTAGLRAGDLIQEIDGERVLDVCTSGSSGLAAPAVPAACPMPMAAPWPAAGIARNMWATSSIRRSSVWWVSARSAPTWPVWPRPWA